MFSDIAYRTRFAKGVVAAWFTACLLHLLRAGIGSIAVTNFFYAVGGGQNAPADEQWRVFVHAIRTSAAGTAVSVGIVVVISVSVATWIAIKYPKWHYLIFALTGAALSMTPALLMMASIDWLGGLVGALSSIVAGRIIRGGAVPSEQQVP